MSKINLPFLYKIDGNKRERVWIVKIAENRVITKSGETGGKLIVSEREYEGVNKGKKNETSDSEQAKRVAERLWIKRLDKGYSPKTERGLILKRKILTAQTKTGNVNTNLGKLLCSSLNNERERKEEKKIERNGRLVGFETDRRPMHCQKWSNERKVLKYFDFDEGVYVQPKLDGIRALIQLQRVNSKYYTVLTSRQGKQFLFLNHLREAIKKLLYPKYRDIVLDTELYAHDLSDKRRFNTIQRSCRIVSSKPFENEQCIGIYIFDIVDSTKNQEERFQVLDEIVSNNDDERIQRVPTFLVNSIRELEEKNREFKDSNYEGTVVRSKYLMYEYNKRSLKMRKYKDFQDEEFEIVGVYKNSGVGSEQFVWVCKNRTGKEFKVKPKGTKEQRLEWYKYREKYIGQQLTVQYQELTKDCVPRFPIGIAIRNYE